MGSNPMELVGDRIPFPPLPLLGGHGFLVLVRSLSFIPLFVSYSSLKN